MNDAGNFLIETCDEMVSRDLKQQLLLLNGRWRELFMEVKQVRPSVPICSEHACVINVEVNSLFRDCFIVVAWAYLGRV